MNDKLLVVSVNSLTGVVTYANLVEHKPEALPDWLVRCFGDEV